MKNVLFASAALVSMLAFAPAASAACLLGCTQVTVDSDYSVGSIAGAGGFSVLSGTIKKQTTYSATGTVNEADLTVKIDQNGAKKIDGTFRSAGYAVQENSVKGTGFGSASVSASGVQGGMNVNVKVVKTGM